MSHPHVDSSFLFFLFNIYLIFLCDNKFGVFMIPEDAGCSDSLKEDVGDA